MFEKVGRLAYCLDVLLNLRIHLIFSVAQLEYALSPSQDLF